MSGDLVFGYAWVESCGQQPYRNFLRAVLEMFGILDGGPNYVTPAAVAVAVRYMAWVEDEYDFCPAYAWYTGLSETKQKLVCRHAARWLERHCHE